MSSSENKRPFKVKKNTCDCHPETCSCNDYAVLKNGKKIATSMNELELENLVLSANLGHAYLKSKEREEQKEGQKSEHICGLQGFGEGDICPACVGTWPHNAPDE